VATCDWTLWSAKLKSTAPGTLGLKSFFGGQNAAQNGAKMPFIGISTGPLVYYMGHP
jgi:hypothetical protein